MIEFDADVIAKAVDRRSGEQKWRPDLARIVSAICSWQAEHPTADVDYEDGRPNADMRQMVEAVARDAGADEPEILASFGAAHCLLCDVVPGFRPVLHSAWDRRVAADHHG